MLALGIAGAVRFDPAGLSDGVTALPIQIFRMASNSKPPIKEAASAGIIVLLAMILLLNGLAIFVRNKFQRTW